MVHGKCFVLPMLRCFGCCHACCDCCMLWLFVWLLFWMWHSGCCSVMAEWLLRRWFVYLLGISDWKHALILYSTCDSYWLDCHLSLSHMLLCSWWAFWSTCSPSLNRRAAGWWLSLISRITSRSDIISIRKYLAAKTLSCQRYDLHALTCSTDLARVWATDLVRTCSLISRQMTFLWLLTGGSAFRDASV